MTGILLHFLSTSLPHSVMPYFNRSFSLFMSYLRFSIFCLFFSFIGYTSTARNFLHLMKWINNMEENSFRLNSPNNYNCSLSNFIQFDYIISIWVHFTWFNHSPQFNPQAQIHVNEIAIPFIHIHTHLNQSHNYLYHRA